MQKDNPEIVFIVNAFDFHNDDKLIFNIIDYCKKNKIDFYIFWMTDDYVIPKKMINLEKNKIIEANKEILHKKYPHLLIEYSDIDELFNNILTKLQNPNINIKIKGLYLENIGNFDKLDIDFDDKLNIFIGLNGSGKTTILRAIAFGLVGFNHNNFEKDSIVDNFLKIDSLIDGLIIRKSKGVIQVKYSINDNEYINKIELIKEPDETFKIESQSNFYLLSGNILKSLVVGFSQVRGEQAKEDKETRLKNPITPPNITDLMSLINNSNDKRLVKFWTWISDLYAEANKKELEQKKESAERKTITKTFEIISQITEKKIEFLTVRKQSTNDVWVKTCDSPNGIPVRLLSQGYQTIIGWIGYFIQRLMEAYPNSKDFTKEYSVLLVDEVDTYFHPEWQSRIMTVLLENFPKTQFIISTQSPLIVNGLNRNQIIILNKENETNSVATKNEVDIWAWRYDDILKRLFGTFLQTKYNLTELKEKLKKYENKEKLTQEEEKDVNKIKERIDKLKESELALDEEEIKNEKIKLVNKQKELDELIEALKAERK